MALEEYCGAIALEINGREFEIISLSEEIKGRRKPVKTMNRLGRTKGFARTIPDYTLTVEVPIPLRTTEPDWEEVEDAKITQYPLSRGGQRTTYHDCYVIDVGARYQVDNEAVRSITFGAVRKITE